jgi:hypothetical protein
LILMPELVTTMAQSFAYDRTIYLHSTSITFHRI